MAEEITIDQLPAVVSPSLDHLFAAMKGGAVFSFSGQQLADLIYAVLIDSAPATLDTLNEIAAALGDDPDFAASVATALAARLEKTQNLADLANAAEAAVNLLGGAEGDILYRGASAWLKLAKGAAGQKLRQNAGLTAPEWESGYELIEDTGDLTSLSAYAKTGLSAYRDLKLDIYATFSASDPLILARTSSNNGSSYDGGASDYRYGELAADGSAAVIGAGLSSSIIVEGGEATGLPSRVFLDLANFNKATYCIVSADSYTLKGTAGYVAKRAYWRLSTTARDAIRISLSSGNFATFRAVLWGRRG